jgi:hypothetical protein
MLKSLRLLLLGFLLTAASPSGFFPVKMDEDRLADAIIISSGYYYIPQFTGIFREIPLTRLGFGRLVSTKSPRVQESKSAEPSTSPIHGSNQQGRDEPAVVMGIFVLAKILVHRVTERRCLS